MSGQFKAYLMNNAEVICFMETKEGDKTFWEFPLILETFTQQHPQTKELMRTQGFKPLVPINRDTKFQPVKSENMLAVEIFDSKLENLYANTTREIKAHLSGLITPKPEVGKDSGLIVGS